MTDAFAGVPLRARSLIETPLGPMTAMSTARGLAALLFATDKVHPGPFDEVPFDGQDAHNRAAAEWLGAYWRGERPSTATLTLDLHGTPFQRAVWQALLRIPPGRTWTYGQVASEVGTGAAPRATGSAIGRNPLAVVVPCHRVIGANGSLTGYAGGLPLKQRLLQHEGAWPA